MRIETVNTDDQIGWNEITTKRIRLGRMFRNQKREDQAYLTAGEWVNAVESGVHASGGRIRCECCQVKWKDCDPELPTYLVMSNKGNKVLCVDCMNQFGYDIPATSGGG